MTEIQGNKAIEDAAIAWVMQLEQRTGRTPEDTRHRGAPADISSPPRLIEVKAFGRSNRGYDLWLEVRQVEEARRNPDFFIYVVENVRQGDPSKFTLKVLGGALLARLLQRAREQRYFTVPWPVADYDTAPASLTPEDGPMTPPDAKIEHRASRLPETEAAAVYQSAGPTVGSAVVEFKDDDPSYLAWIKARKGGWVVNADRVPKARYLQLHKASCPAISDERKAGAYTERQYIKYCAEDRQELDSFFKRLLGAEPRWRCPQCR